MSGNSGKDHYPGFTFFFAVPGIVIIAGILYGLNVPGWLIISVVLIIFTAFLLTYLKSIRA